MMGVWKDIIISYLDVCFCLETVLCFSLVMSRSGTNKRVDY